MEGIVEEDFVKRIGEKGKRKEILFVISKLLICLANDKALIICKSNSKYNAQSLPLLRHYY